MDEYKNDSGSVKCNCCGELNPFDSEFCAECGQKIERIKQQPEYIFCSKCNFPNDTESMFCGGCGEPLITMSKKKEIKPGEHIIQSHVNSEPEKEYTETEIEFEEKKPEHDEKKISKKEIDQEPSDEKMDTAHEKKKEYYDPQITRDAGVRIKGAFSRNTCPYCGVVNSDDSAYCEECGKQLMSADSVFHRTEAALGSVASVVVPVIKQQRGNLAGLSSKSKKRLVAILIGVAILLSVSAGINYLTSPKAVAKNYFDAYINNKYTAMYKYYGDLPSSDFVNKKLYSALKSKSSSGYNDQIISYKLSDKKDETKTDDIMKTYSFECAYRGDTMLRPVPVTVIKSGKILFFDKWEVSAQDIISENIRITANKNTEITIEGIKLSKKYITDEEGESVTYIIPEMLSGEYDIKYTADGELKTTTLYVFGSSDFYLY